MFMIRYDNYNVLDKLTQIVAILSKCIFTRRSPVRLNDTKICLGPTYLVLLTN